MKHIYHSIFFCFIAFISHAQSTVVTQIREIASPDAALKPLLFLSTDELKGRATARSEIKVAAKYISDEFRNAGVKEVSGTKDYYQNFDIKFVSPPKAGTITISNKTFEINKDLIQVRGTTSSFHAPMVFAGYGNEIDITKIDVKGKIVITNAGENDSTSARRALFYGRRKQKLLQEKGAVGLIEIYKRDIASWEFLMDHYMHDRVASAQDSMLPVFSVYDTTNSLMPLIQNAEATINVSGSEIRIVPSENVMGWVEGTDAKLKEQFIVLSAHYDHIGVGKPKMEEGKLDSIYNGARDNAAGVAAVINAAKYFAKYPSKRSILFIAYTGEEIGLIGSRYFAEHPALPLNKLVYNLNIDNASYNDTTIITLIGHGRTSSDKDIKKACKAFGLIASPDLSPEQNLFDRSDNVSLAVKGIPSPTFAMGIRKFDETITNRYHQLSDETGNFDLNYAVKFMQSYILAVKNIADNKKQPVWSKGDKYEAAWKKLYGK